MSIIKRLKAWLDKPLVQFCTCDNWTVCGCGNQPPYHCMWCCRDLTPEQLSEWDFERDDFGPTSERYFVGPRVHPHIARGDDPEHCMYCGAPYPPKDPAGEDNICYAESWGAALPMRYYG